MRGGVAEFRRDIPDGQRFPQQEGTRRLMAPVHPVAVRRNSDDFGKLLAEIFVSPTMGPAELLNLPFFAEIGTEKAARLLDLFDLGAVAVGLPERLGDHAEQQREKIQKTGFRTMFQLLFQFEILFGPGIIRRELPGRGLPGDSAECPEIRIGVVSQAEEAFPPAAFQINPDLVDDSGDPQEIGVFMKRIMFSALPIHILSPSPEDQAERKKRKRFRSGDTLIRTGLVEKSDSQLVCPILSDRTEHDLVFTKKSTSIYHFTPRLPR